MPGVLRSWSGGSKGSIAALRGNTVMETISQAGAPRALPPPHMLALGGVDDSARASGGVSSPKPACPGQSPGGRAEGVGVPPISGTESVAVYQEVGKGP